MSLVRISNRVISCFEEEATSPLLHHNILPIFMSIGAISSCLMSLVQGHFTCQSFALTGCLIHVLLTTKDFICISSTYFAETYLFFQLSLSTSLSAYIRTGFANFIDEWSHCDFCFTKFGVILEYLESSITTEKVIFRLSSMWSWHVYTIVYTWKAQIHDGSHRVNFDRNLPSSCFVVQYNSLILMI